MKRSPTLFWPNSPWRAARTSAPRTRAWAASSTDPANSVPIRPRRRPAHTSSMPSIHWPSKRARSQRSMPKMRDSLAAVPSRMTWPTYSARRSEGVLRSIEVTSVPIWRRYQAREQSQVKRMTPATAEASRIVVRSLRAPRACWAEKFSEPTCWARRSSSATSGSSRWPMVTGRSSGAMTRCWTRIVRRNSRLSIAGPRNGKATRWTRKMAAMAPSVTQGVEPLVPPLRMMVLTSRPMARVAPMVAAASKMLARKMAATPPRSACQASLRSAGTGRRANAARGPRGRGVSINAQFGEEALVSCPPRQAARDTRKTGATRKKSRPAHGPEGPAPGRPRRVLEAAEPVQDVQDREAVQRAVERDQADVLANARAAAPAAVVAPAELSRLDDGLEAEHLGTGGELEHLVDPL